MPAALVVILFYGGLSSLFSLLTLGRVSTPPQFDLVESLRSNIWDILGHFIFGSLAFAPAFLVSRSRGFVWTMTCGFLAVAVDMDHIAAIAGLQTLGRASHSLGFMLFTGIAMSALAMVLPVRSRIPPGLAGLMGMIAVISHIALDAVLGSGEVPLLAPVSLRLFVFSPWEGLALQLGCMAVVAVWVLVWRRGRAPR